MADLFLFGLAAHLIADWFPQNDWMARNKANLLHPVAWVHSGIHFLAFLLVFPREGALFLFVTHLMIDTRTPLVWWRKTLRQTSDPANPASLHVAIWQDQAAHILLVLLVAWVTARTN